MQGFYGLWPQKRRGGQCRALVVALLPYWDQRELHFHDRTQLLQRFLIRGLMLGLMVITGCQEEEGAQLETFHNGCLRQMMGLHRGPDGP